MVTSWACSRLMLNGDAASTAPALAVVSSRRREIDPDLMVFLVMASSAEYCIWLLLYRSHSNSSERRKDKLRRQRNLGDNGAERFQRIVHRVGDGKRRSRRIR